MQSCSGRLGSEQHRQCESFPHTSGMAHRGSGGFGSVGGLRFRVQGLGFRARSPGVLWFML